MKTSFCFLFFFLAACSSSKGSTSSPEASRDGDDAGASPSRNGDEGAALPLGTRWNARAAMPVGRTSFAYAVVGDRIYVLGGNDDAGDSARVDIYDPIADTWTDGPALPTARTALAAAASAKELCVFGGLSKGKFSNEVLCLDVDAGTWQTMAPLSSARSLIAAVALGDRLYAVGGRAEGFATVATVESLDPIANTWRAEPALPRGREGASAVVLDGRLVVAGGFFLQDAGEQYLDEILTLDDGAWNLRAHLTEPAVALAGAAVGTNEALFVGGYADRGDLFLDRVESFDLAKARAEAHTPLPEARGGLGLAVVARRVFAFGGGALVPQHPWDPRADIWELER